MVWILVILGILVGIGIMSQPNDAGCLGGWLFILLVIVLGAVGLIGAH